MIRWINPCLKKGVVFLIVPAIIAVSALAYQTGGRQVKTISNYPFLPGEKIFYKVNFSIFTVGKAEVVLSPVIYRMDGKKYYRIDINGKTAGAGQIVTTVNDNWGALLDTASLLPYKTWRNLEEGRYRRREFVDFDHAKGKLKVNVFEYYTGKLKESKEYNIKKSPAWDMASGYMFLRMIRYDDLKKGDTIQLYGFLEDTFYDLTIVYMGKEKLDTKLGTILAHKLVPIMPKNSLFSGDRSIAAWLSADELKIPVKIQAKMFIGHVGCEITGIEGTLAYPDFTD
jgi:hypothetical protein